MATKEVEMNMKSARRIGAASLVIAAALTAGRSVSAQAVGGAIVIAAAEPSDFVVQLDKPGPCGSVYFHIQRSSTNFKEAVAMFLTAFAANKNIVVFVTGCVSDRNIISHGYVGR